MSTTAQEANTRPRAPQDFKKKAAVREALDETQEILIDGVPYKITPADLTGLVEMRIRKETGYSAAQIGEMLVAAPGADLVGMFMWACRIAKGDEVSLEEVLGSVSGASVVEVKDGAEPDPPEA